MMVVSKGPRRPMGWSIHAMRRNGRLTLARHLWRAAYVLLVGGGWMLKYSIIGPVGMSRIWKCAQALENMADAVRYRN